MESEQPLRHIEQRDLLADRAHREIQSAIFAHKLPPGTALSVPKLARQLDISRSPVREAVQRLVHEGLAVSASHRGAVVAYVGVEDLQYLYEVREMLEGLAARRATERLDRTVQDDLKGLVEQHRKVLEEDGGVLAHIELDMQFHRRIREQAGNRYLAESLETLQGRIRLAMHSLWRSEDAPRLALGEHEEILDAMLTGDPVAAETAARAHIARIRSDLAGSERYRRREQ